MAGTVCATSASMETGINAISAMTHAANVQALTSTNVSLVQMLAIPSKMVAAPEEVHAPQACTTSVKPDNANHAQLTALPANRKTNVINV